MEYGLNTPRLSPYSVWIGLALDRASLGILNLRGMWITLNYKFKSPARLRICPIRPHRSVRVPSPVWQGSLLLLNCPSE